MSNINEIMSKHLMGTATEEEEALLREYADPDTVREILQADDLAERYDAYSQVDVEKALESILQRGERKGYIQDCRCHSRSRCCRSDAVVPSIYEGNTAGAVGSSTDGHEAERQEREVGGYDRQVFPAGGDSPG